MARAGLNPAPPYLVLKRFTPVRTKKIPKIWWVPLSLSCVLLCLIEMKQKTRMRVFMSTAKNVCQSRVQSPSSHSPKVPFDASNERPVSYVPLAAYGRKAVKLTKAYGTFASLLLPKAVSFSM